MKSVAINGFGRIGRMILRAYIELKQHNLCSQTKKSINIKKGDGNEKADDLNFEIVCINDIGSLEDIVYLFKYDSVHGMYKGDIKVGKDYFDVGFGKIKYIKESDPSRLPWKELGIDIVLECSGIDVKRRVARNHLKAGAKKVIISTIYDEADQTIVYGINENVLNKNHKIISCASCTSNCIVPIIQVLEKNIGIEYGHMNSIHAYTNGQNLVDSLHQDRLRARAVSSSMIPSSTNAARAVELLFPELKNRIKCNAIRVPILNVSMIEFIFVSKKSISIKDINDNIIEASNSYLKGILGYNDEPMVSIDFTHDSRSAIVDISHTQVTKNKFCRILAWYDNEWGYANRMCDLTNFLNSFQKNEKELSGNEILINANSQL
ncbi:MAG: aldehyde dehydrogenase [Bacteroidetes bacterium]|nr:aldehyde dehydrogenase [Bacteroidota bacterium]